MASNSWESGTESQPLSQTKLVHAYLVRAAAEGVGMYFSAGDGSGSSSRQSTPTRSLSAAPRSASARPANGCSRRAGQRGSLNSKNEWVSEGKTARREAGQACTGPTFVPEGRRAEVDGHTRSAPDIAADADPFTGIDVGLLTFNGKTPTFFEESIGGTSESSPLVAGMVTAAQQGQRTPFGFINPAIYTLKGPAPSSTPSL